MKRNNPGQRAGVGVVARGGFTASGTGSPVGSLPSLGVGAARIAVAAGSNAEAPRTVAAGRTVAAPRTEARTEARNTHRTEARGSSEIRCNRTLAERSSSAAGSRKALALGGRFAAPRKSRAVVARVLAALSHSSADL